LGVPSFGLLTGGGRIVQLYFSQNTEFVYSHLGGGELNSMGPGELNEVLKARLFPFNYNNKKRRGKQNKEKTA